MPRRLMQTRPAILAAILCSGLVLWPGLPAAAGQEQESSKLAPLRFPDRILGLRPGHVNRTAVHKLLGTGHYVEEGGHGGTTFYTDPARRIVLSVVYGVDWGVEEIALEENPDRAAQLPGSAISGKLTPAPTLAAGIGLGTPVSEVLKRYGTPSQDRTRQDARIIEYETDYRTTRDVLSFSLRFTVREGRVVEYSVYNGE